MEVSPETYYLLALQAFKKRNNVAEKIPELCKFVRAVDLKYLGKFDYMNEGELKTALTRFMVPVMRDFRGTMMEDYQKEFKKPIIVDGKKFFNVWDLQEENDGSLSGASDEFLNSIWEDSSTALDGQKKNARGGERYSPRMTSDMTEQERYDKLKDLSLTVTASVNRNAISEAEAKYGTDIRDGVRLKSNDRKKLFQKIASIFGITRDYRNHDIELEFGFSNENLSESLNKQKRYYYSYLKMLSCFENVVDSAIGIETHNRNKAGYKVDPTLKNMYVLVSAFQDGENITPVKLEIKEFSDRSNTLYVAIALDSIPSDIIGNKKSGIATEGNTVSGVTQSAPPLTISLADLFANVNPQDSSFLKYVPTQFLTEQQRAGEKYSSRTGDNIGGLQAELYQLKEQRKKLLEDDPVYRAAVEQRRYANTFTERVSASKALKAAESNIDTSAIDSNQFKLLDPFIPTHPTHQSPASYRAEHRRNPCDAPGHIAGHKTRPTHRAAGFHSSRRN